MNDVAPAPPVTTAIRLARDGAVGSITIARPEKLNALNRAALEELALAAAWFDRVPEVKVVVVTGEGTAFSAGFDLDDRRWRELGPPERSVAVGRAMADAIGNMQAITIGAIRGHCIGGGVVLASACDLRVASANATFRIPEVDLGIPLFWTGVPRLTREIGPALVKELVLTGRPFDAHEAKGIRFVNRVVADSDLESSTAELAQTLASKPARVLRTTKRQVEDVAPSVPAGDDDAELDVAALAAAFADPESQAIAARYAEGLRRREP